MNTVTILILNFNQSRFLSQAIESVKRQTLKPEQIIFIDDGSSEIDFASARHIVEREKIFDIAVFDGINMGHTKRMNQAVSLCSSTYLMLLSADDWLEDDALEQLMRSSNGNEDVIWGNLNVINEDGNRISHVRPRGTWQGKTARKYIQSGHIFEDLLKVNSFVTGGMSLIKASSVVNYGGWDNSVTTEDFDLWLRMGKDANFRYVDEIVGNYRKVSGSKSRNDDQKLLDQARIFSKHSGSSKILDFRIAYLIGMRWALAVLRQKKPLGVKLRNLANVCGVSLPQVFLMLPLAIARPIFGTALAQFRPINFRFLLKRLSR